MLLHHFGNLFDRGGLHLAVNPSDVDAGVEALGCGEVEGDGAAVCKRHRALLHLAAAGSRGKSGGDQRWICLRCLHRRDRFGARRAFEARNLRR